MRIATGFSRRWKIAVAVLALLVCGLVSQTQRSFAQSTAQIGTSSPLPVFVTNTPPLPDGFSAGSTWRFTTWTTPSVFTWTATVNRTSGPWAHLTVSSEDGKTSSSWYYVPNMPGSWQQQ